MPILSLTLNRNITGLHLANTQPYASYDRPSGKPHDLKGIGRGGDVELFKKLEKY
jgi:hypothetical protein